MSSIKANLGDEINKKGGIAFKAQLSNLRLIEQAVDTHFFRHKLFCHFFLDFNMIKYECTPDDCISILRFFQINCPSKNEKLKTIDSKLLKINLDSDEKEKIEVLLF